MSACKVAAALGDERAPEAVPGFARHGSQLIYNETEEGANGGNMVSPVTAAARYRSISHW